MHLCVYSLFTFLFLHLSLISISNANADITCPLNSWNFEESALIEFVKGRKYFDHFYKKWGCCRAQINRYSLLKENRKRMKEDLALRFKSILGTFYLLVENWNCDNILEQIQGDNKRTKCQKYRKYLNFVYEYLFRVFIKGMPDPKLSEQMPAVAPRFQHKSVLYSIIDIIEFLNKTSKFYFNLEYSRKNNFKLDKHSFKPTLLNEEALNKVDEIIQMHQLKRSDQKIAKILAEINEALKSDKFFAIFNDKRFKIAPMLLQKCWNITKQTEIGINYSEEFQQKVPEDILQQFVGNSEIEIRKQFHEFLKQMYEETVNNSNTISTRYEERDIYNDFLESPFRDIAATVSKRKKPGPGSSLTDQPAEKMAKLVIDPNSKDPLV